MSFLAKRMFDGVQPSRAVRLRAVGPCRGACVELAQAVRCRSSRGACDAGEGRAQRGLNLLLKHFSTNAYGGIW